MRFFKLPHRYLVGMVVIICGISYFRTLNVPYYFDDFACVSKNPLIRDFSNYFKDNIVIQGTVLEDTLNIFKTRPLSFLSFSINHYFNGVDVGGYHLVNIMIHMINAALLYAFITNVSSINALRDDRKGCDVTPDDFRSVAFFVSSLFAVHPIMTNAVTYITQRMTSLVSLFYLITMVLYERYLLCDDNRYRKAFIYLMSLLSSCAAMLTKETAFTLPVMLLFFDMIFCDSSIRSRLMRLIPFIATMTIIPYNVIGLKNSEALQTTGALSTAMNLVNFTGISTHDYLLTQINVVIFYIKKLMFPIGLSLEHRFPLSTSILDVGVIFSSVLHLAITGCAVALMVSSRKRLAGDIYRRMAAFGICWFYIALSVESSVIPITEVAVEYRLYLPAVGLFISAVCTIHLLLNHHFPLIVAERIKIWILSSIVMALMVATIARNEVWRDPVSFWGRTIAQYPELSRPYANLADYFVEKRRFEEARDVYRNAIEIIPNADVLHYELGRLYIQAEDYTRAIDEFITAIQIAPGRTRAYYGLAQAYAFTGDYDRVDAVLDDVRAMN